MELLGLFSIGVVAGAVSWVLLKVLMGFPGNINIHLDKFGATTWPGDEA